MDHAVVATGVVDDHQFATHACADLQPGDALLLFTDGIVESFNERDEQFGEQRLVQTISEMIGQPSSRVIEEIFRRVHRFSSDSAYQDDMTAVLVKVQPNFPAAPDR